MQQVWAKNTSNLNKQELVKLKKDGLDILDDLDKYSQQGFSAINEEDLDLMKWAGLYSHKSPDGHFMMRVKIPGGIMSSTQAHTLAGIARDFGRGLVDITTRQAIQFHWLSVENLPDIYNRLSEVGLSSVEACGDCPRTVVGNPLHGIDPDELLDASQLVQEVYNFFQNNREFSNLPRKYKISISGNQLNVNHAEINDIAFTPAVKEINGNRIKGFHVKVGGGLSTKPYLAQVLDIFVRPEEVLKVAVASTAIFRDHGYRGSRSHNRLKFLVADWGSEKFKTELIKLTGSLASRGEDLTKGWNAGYFYGVHQQKQPGLCYVGLSVPVGRMDADELEELVKLAEEYGDGSIRTCNSQNIILPNIPQVRVEQLLAEKLLQRLTPFPNAFIAHSVSCPGNQFCNKAVVETKDRLRSIAEYLDKHVKIDTPIRINASGCPNSCGQQQIADIGLQGSVTKIDGKRIDAFEILIGGWLGNNPSFGIKLKGRVPGDNIAQAIEHLVNFYLDNRIGNEVFGQFVRRVGVEKFQEKLNEFLGVEQLQKMA
jgi:ferredoxin-nitrite reductase